MIIRGIYCGSVKILRVYLGSRLVWWSAIPWYTSGAGFAFQAAEASVYTARGSPAGGTLGVSQYNRAAAYGERGAQILMICVADSACSAGGEGIPAENTQGAVPMVSAGSAAAVTYRIAWARGASCEETGAQGRPGPAGTVSGAGASLGTDEENAQPRVAGTMPSAGMAYGNSQASGAAQIQTPEQICMACNAAMTAAAGVGTAMADRTAGMVCGSAVIEATVVESYKDSEIELIISTDESGSVYLQVDGSDYPIENVSDPEESGTDNTYIIQII